MCTLFCGTPEGIRIIDSQCEWGIRIVLFAKNSPQDCFLNAQTLTGSNPLILEHKIKREHTEVYSLLMARRKGFEPPTFWFVAKHYRQIAYIKNPQKRWYTLVFGTFIIPQKHTRIKEKIAIFEKFVCFLCAWNQRSKPLICSHLRQVIKQKKKKVVCFCDLLAQKYAVERKKWGKPLKNTFCVFLKNRSNPLNIIQM